MKVQVLYFDDCPHYLPAVELIADTLRSEGIDAEIERVAVTTEQAQTHAFPGSPTVRINGLDVEPEARIQSGYGFGCRTYLHNGKRTGMPSRQLIESAIREAVAGLPVRVVQKHEPVRQTDCCTPSPRC